MDAFDPIRKAAGELHHDLVVAGSNALNILELVTNAASKLDIDVAWLPPGDPVLKGAHALFDEQSGTIFCRATDNDCEKASLVAHEIGHAVLHSASSACTKDDIDPSRSIETVPVGLQRVEDYGTRERRELQANVFARELLLPRSLAYWLHVNHAMSASKIAERTGLSIALVRQQLFDALLLPPETGIVETRKATHVPKLDASQERAAAHRDTPFQLQAGPGTGKTRTLLHRVCSLLKDGIDPAALLVLTFSNRSAGELVERLISMVPEAVPRMWIGTFHAFGLDIIRRHHDRFGLSSNPTLFGYSDAIEVLEEILPTLPLVHYCNLWDPARILRDVVIAISRAKDELLDKNQYRSLAEAMWSAAGDDAEKCKAAEKCLEIADIYDLYERAKHDRGAIDFGDLIMLPTFLLESDSALRQVTRLRHRHLLVDEYQDVNRASARLLKAVAGDGKRLWVVGDVRQSIYRFRGASSTNMSGFRIDYPGAVIDQLTVNYRSSDQVVSSFVAAAAHMATSEQMLPLDLKSDRGIGSARPQLQCYETLDKEVEGIAASIREIEQKGISLRDQAVLCRTNNRLNEIATGLEKLGIPVLHLGSLFERDEVRDLLALISLAVDPFGDGLVRVGAMPRYKLSLQDVYKALRYIRTTDGTALSKLASVTLEADLSKEGEIALARLVQDLRGIKINTSAWEFLSAYLLDRTDGMRRFPLESVNDQLRAVAIWQFLNFIRESSPTGPGFPIQRTLNRVRQLVLLAEERDLRQVPAAAFHLDAVRLMTVHAAKGLEFEAVHIPGLTTSSFPSSYRGQRCPPPVDMIDGLVGSGLSVSDRAKRSHREEEECLFFVAISRARTYLHLYFSRRQPNGNNRNPSAFLDWLPKGLVKEVADPATLPLPDSGSNSTLIEVSVPSEWPVTSQGLKSYDSCPRRFLYTHMLKLGGARKTTAFSRTHDCLYEFIRWLTESRRVASPTIADSEIEFERIWQSKGPIGHGLSKDYRRLATRLIEALVHSGVGTKFQNVEPLSVEFPNGRVLIEPDEVVELPDSRIALRRIRTGRKRSDEYDHLDYTLYKLAAQAHFGDRSIVEAVHLTDKLTETADISERKIRNRRNRINDLLAGIASGQFPPKVSKDTCPRCPHFFVCPATPQGSLTLL